MDERIAFDVLADFEVLYDPSLVDERDKLLNALTNTRAIIVRNRTRVDEALLDRAPSLSAVGRLGVGLDNIDLDACKSRGVAVYPASGANDVAVAEYVVAATLMLLRGVWQANAAMLAGHWPRGELMGREATGKRLGLIGFGAIARQVAMRARALGMAIAAFDPYLTKDDPAWDHAARLSLQDLAAGCDVVSVHVPLTNETRHIVDAEFIEGMPKGAILINAARGGVVDERALVGALQDGRLGGAAFDVFESEPLIADGAERFRGVPNLLLTPHIAGITGEANLRVSRMTAENVRNHLNR